MSDADEFHAEYIAALRTYLDARDEDSLAVGHELGRRALQERVSMLDIIEHHVRLILEMSENISWIFSKRAWMTRPEYSMTRLTAGAGIMA